MGKPGNYSVTIHDLESWNALKKETRKESCIWRFLQRGGIAWKRFCACGGVGSERFGDSELPMDTVLETDNERKY